MKENLRVILIPKCAKLGWILVSLNFASACSSIVDVFSFAGNSVGKAAFSIDINASGNNEGRIGVLTRTVNIFSRKELRTFTYLCRLWMGPFIINICRNFIPIGFRWFL